MLIKTLLKALLGLTGSYLFSRLYVILRWLPTYFRYKSAGVFFPNGWNYFADSRLLRQIQKSNPHGLDLDKALKASLKTENLPSIVGFCFQGVPSLFVLKAGPLSDMYKAKNQYFTKSHYSTDAYYHVMRGSMLMDRTSDPTY